MLYDLAVIGGGPAGMMAAGRAGELGCRVILLEKNVGLGIKLLLTGKGRCNLTNQAPIKKIIERFGVNGKFLYPALQRFGPEETMAFFTSRGLATKVERGQRVFPSNDQAKSVLQILVNYLRAARVKIKTCAAVKNIIWEHNRITKAILTDREEILARHFAICTGGKSYPATGSTGEGYQWLKNFGHTIIKPSPALVPIICQERFIKQLEGLSLKNVTISIYRDNKKIISRLGEAIFTADGLSGPVILEISKKIGQALPAKLKLQIDFKPALDFNKLDQRIQRDFQTANNKMFKNSLHLLLPQKIIPIIISLSGIAPDKKINLVTHEERKKLLHLLKEFTLTIKKLAGFEKAIITTGGVKLSELDPQTMGSKLIANLYLAGEILNLDGPTGGYNLQACWSTGYLAGESMAEAKKFKNID